MPDKEEIRKELLKIVEQYVNEGIPEDNRVKAHKLIKAVMEGKHRVTEPTED